MACFLVSATEAVVTTIAEKELEKKGHHSAVSVATKMKWLRNMLAGGSVLLAFEHVWHGEITPWFPFLTAASNPADTAEMLHEMATVGVGMAAVVTLVWAGMVVVVSAMEKRIENTSVTEE